MVGIVMGLAIPQLLIMEAGLLGPFPGQFFNARDGLALFLRLKDLPEQDLSCFGMLMKVIIQVLFQEIRDVIPHTWSFRSHILRTQFGFCLGFEYRFLDFDTEGQQ